MSQRLLDGKARVFGPKKGIRTTAASVIKLFTTVSYDFSQ